MNAATRAQVLALVKRTMDAGRPRWPERVARIFKAANARDRARLPAGRWPGIKPIELEESLDPFDGWDASDGWTDADPGL